MKEWMRMAMEPDVVKRGLKFAIVVGAILIAINHGGAILAGEIDSARILSMALTVFVPYAVSTLSSVAAMRHARSEREER